MKFEIGRALKGLQHALSDNSPAILTGIGVAGTVTTAILAGKGAWHAARHTGEGPADPTFQEQVKETWKFYIPAAISGTTTIVCIVASNKISSKRTAAIISAYSVSETLFKEYKDKVVETLGEKKELAMRDEIAQDRIAANPASEREVIITGSGEVLCYETLTGRYFKSDMETLRKAQNDINAQLINEGYASLNDFFGTIGLASTSYGEEVGWTVDEMLDIHFSTVLSEDGKPCISVGYKTTPVRNYYRFN